MIDTVSAPARGHPARDGERDADTPPGAGLGAKVRALREGLGLSQAALAERVGVEQSFISHVETGRVKEPSAKYLRLLARGLGVGVTVLMLAAGQVTEAELGALAGAAR